MLKIDGGKVEVRGTGNEIIQDFVRALLITKDMLCETYQPEVAEKVINNIVKKTFGMTEEKDYKRKDIKADERTGNGAADILPKEIHGQPGADRE